MKDLNQAFKAAILDRVQELGLFSGMVVLMKLKELLSRCLSVEDLPELTPEIVKWVVDHEIQHLLAQAQAAYLHQRSSVMFAGPLESKSDIISQVARDLEVNVVIVRPDYDPTDWLGIPKPFNVEDI